MSSRQNTRKQYLDKLKSVYCSACLSCDRILSSLGDFSEIYHKVCENYATVMNSEINLCYECLALLRKIIKFQEKVRCSHEILKNHIKDKKHELKSQSSLSIIQPILVSSLDDYDDNKGELYIEELKQEVEEDINDFYDINIESLEEIVEDKQKTVKKENYVDHNDVDQNNYHQNEEDRNNEVVDKPININIISGTLDSASDMLNSNDHLNIQLISDAEIVESMECKGSLKHESKKQSKYQRIIKQTKNSYKQDKVKLKKIYQKCKNRKQIYHLRISSKIYKRRSENPGSTYSRKTISPLEVHYWLEKERNSDYFKQVKHKCEKCAMRVGASGVGLHKQCHLDKGYTCDYCGQSFLKQLQLLNHMTCHYYIWNCKLCDFKCVSKENICNHHRDVHSRKIQCLSCLDYFGTLDAFYEHFNEVHLKFYNTFICDYCSKTFTTKKLLEKHIPLKHQPRKCEVCNVIFSTSTKLSNHKQINHKNPEETYCVTCDKHFKNNSMLKHHLNTTRAHAGESQNRSFPCPAPECNRIFSTKMSMENHHNFVHLNKFQYYCSECNKPFVSKYHLKAHLRRRVHNTGLQLPKTKICTYCGRAFGTNKILRHHIRTHTGERPHACPHCDSKFAQKSAMQTHIKNIHAKEQNFAQPECLF